MTAIRKRNQRLIYVVGPSGVGKDSVLNWLWIRLQVSPNPSHMVTFARRSITRPLDSTLTQNTSNEAHEPVTDTIFTNLLAAHAFGMYWEANDLRYGIRLTELIPLEKGHWVFVNGSRAYLEQAKLNYPGLTAIHIIASEGVLRNRLFARGREDSAAIEARLLRTRQQLATIEPGDLTVMNEGTLDQTGEALCALLRLRTGLDIK